MSSDFYGCRRHYQNYVTVSLASPCFSTGAIFWNTPTYMQKIVFRPFTLFPGSGMPPLWSAVRQCLELGRKVSIAVWRAYSANALAWWIMNTGLSKCSKAIKVSFSLFIIALAFNKNLKGQLKKALTSLKKCANKKIKYFDETFQLKFWNKVILFFEDNLLNSF